MNKIKTSANIEDLVGRICKAIIPIRKEYYVGRGTDTAICTLSSLDLMERISQMTSVMDRVAVVGRLLSENRGIDQIIEFTLEHPRLERILICGKEVKGHRAGQALVSLARNGANADGRIIGALGPYPILRTKQEAIVRFRGQVQVMDNIGLTDVDGIASLVP